MVKSTRPPAAPGATKKSEKGIRKLQLKNTSVGQVFVVGSGDCGQLGLGQDVLERERLSALNYFADHQIVAVYAGGLHNIALSAGGKLFSWGCNDQKALGVFMLKQAGPVKRLSRAQFTD